MSVRRTKSRPSIVIKVKRPAFRYLWMKFVHGFDPFQHCSRSLLGHYSRRLPYPVPRRPFEVAAALDEFASPFVYLCGVTGAWPRNVHIAMKPASDCLFDFEDDAIVVQVKGMRRLTIHPVKLAPAVFGREFTSCRNWQFGVEYLGGQAVLDGMLADQSNRPRQQELWEFRDTYKKSRPGGRNSRNGVDQ